MKKNLSPEQIVDAIKEELQVVFGTHYLKFLPEIEGAIIQFMEQSKEKWKRWLFLYNDNQITKDEWLWLLKSQKNIIELKALQQAGVTKIELNRVKNNILKVIFDTVIKILSS